MWKYELWGTSYEWKTPHEMNLAWLEVFRARWGLCDIVRYVHIQYNLI